MDDERHVIIEDPTLAQGFTQIPNGILRRSDIQPGAKLTYMVLLSYAWQKGTAYPGQDRLASDMGVSERSVITYLKQLQETGLITIRRRGLGKTNLYIIHRITGSENLADQVRGEKVALPEMKNPTLTEVKDLRTKKTQGKDEKEQDSSNYSNGLSQEDRERIAWVVRDLSREFGDTAPVKSSTTRAVNLCARSGLELDEFLDLVQAARVRTKRYTASIKTERNEQGVKPKIAYFFGVLDDLLTG